MILLGLTGSIGMGKSETANMFRREGVPVYDSDAEVHKLQAPGGRALPQIEATFPGVVIDGVLDRAALGQRVFGQLPELRKLEAIIYPMMGKAQRDFLRQATQRGDPVVVLDVPLLFETGGDKYVDASVVVSAPKDLQRKRVLARPDMTMEKFAGVLSQQMPDGEKRKRADYIVHSGLGKAFALQQVRAILQQMKNYDGSVWPTKVLRRRARKRVG
ncbi:MAG: dephospho-CoA kinase [Alphaproteobacteria bacterium]|nr:MAG: dephospho-CoA kinase [Alphaproteobacteria bacterium]